MLASPFLTLAVIVSFSTAGYVLEDDYEPSNFFSMFDFFTGADPTHGYVTYVDQATAQSDGLIQIKNGTVYMGVDHTHVASGRGRSSVRLTSTKAYNHGLVVLDLAHMPGGICGTWPAFWMLGPNWPNDGEIDIIEGVNSQNTNLMTLHTSDGCTIANNGMYSGTLSTSNCYVDAAGQYPNTGCQFDTGNTATFGTTFNARSGGVYATEWTSNVISIWFFARGSIPYDITAGKPDPTGWGTAIASFSGACNIDSFFKDQQIVFDMTFCGAWAGNVWSSDAVCSQKAPTCRKFVRHHPSAFANAYWSVNSLKVYQASGATTSAASPKSTATPALNLSSQAVSRTSNHSVAARSAFAPTASVVDTPALPGLVIVSSVAANASGAIMLSSKPDPPAGGSVFAQAAPTMTPSVATMEPSSAASTLSIAAAAPSTIPACADPTTTDAISSGFQNTTISALDEGDFSGFGEPQTAGVLDPRKDETRLHRHMIRHRKRYGVL